MPQTFINKLLLKKQALYLLQEAGLREVAEGDIDIHAARKIALWRQSSGAEVYLFALLTTASRRMARHYLPQMRLQPGLSTIHSAKGEQALPELSTAYQAYLECYPGEALSLANEPGMATAAIQARQTLLADLFFLDALSQNPATESFKDLLDDSDLASRLDYRSLIMKFAEQVEPLREHGKSLPELLRRPAEENPHNLAEQISYIIKNWSAWLPQEVVTKMQIAIALTEEENRAYLPGPGPSPMPLFGEGDGSDAAAAFTADTDWMTTSVLLAKSIYIWLDQLSSHYQRSITTLADIPEEELVSLANRGFNALWLIGIWERSSASKRIKQLCGNPEAEASAYALHAYRIAEELGGENALQALESRCRQHGIRLACDVVPNHTGIDSELVKEHPDWFLQTDQPPYPAYDFIGPNLSEMEGIGIRIEKGYWDHSDAAVVFEHHDHDSGQRRYIYHGNDGTHMPWNDTAQLNFLIPEVRQAMSDLILAVARRFSLIRFDAAMTLARKHFRRLWFPPPGGSAGVQSRSAFALSDEDFTAAFPVEFWREVVDRINREAPDTLLIAEAFWLMESYFVRNLGMHRVYNSAFMNMLKREENSKYRQILKETLAYNPGILKRYVNFMNNPDEATAVEQFGKGDKYFGVATLLATLPGLPMFGHGQVEGYREKYGMEYRRAYLEEEPDVGFIQHHEQQVFPLLRSRYLFADIKYFSLYDFMTDQGVNENVFAYSNGPIGQKFLVVYNNRTQATRGRIHLAADKASPEEEGLALPMPPFWQELGLDRSDDPFCRFRDLQGNQQLVSREQLSHGLELQLDGYEHRVFSDFQMLRDEDNSWQKLYQHLNGRKVSNLERERLRIVYHPLWKAFAALFDQGRLHVLAGGLVTARQTRPIDNIMTELSAECNAFASMIGSSIDGFDGHSTSPIDLKALFADLSGWLAELAAADTVEKMLAGQWQGKRSQAGLGGTILSWLMLQNLSQSLGFSDESRCFDVFGSYGLDFAWQESAASEDQSRTVFLATLLTKTAGMQPHPAVDTQAFAHLCLDRDNSRFLCVNRHEEQTWFLQEGMTALAGAIALQAGILQLRAGQGKEAPAISKTAAELLRQRLARAAAVGYRLDKFLDLS
jgi:glycosidase